MPFMKNTIIYSLFIVSGINFSLHSQNINTHDNEDLLLIFDSSAEDIYPLEDTDTISFMPEIQNYIDDLEFDPAVKLDSKKVLEKKDQEIITPGHENMLLEEYHTIALPAAPEEIIILDHNNIIPEELSSDLIICQINEDSCQSTDVDTIKSIESSMQIEEYPIHIISQNQLEEILSGQCEQLDRYFDDAILPKPTNDNHCMSVAIDDQNLIIDLDNGISLIEASRHKILESLDDDDIIPVPHDLINSVKKANKQKKKLEKLEKKEKANFFKKSKKENKKKQ